LFFALKKKLLLNNFTRSTINFLFQIQ